MSKRCKKTCTECGKEWGIAKRKCTCGHALTPKKLTTPRPQKALEASKQCPKCKLQWSSNKRVCTCGHSFAKRKHGTNSESKKRTCSACGVIRKGHVCLAKPVRVQSPRVPSKPFADKDQQATPSTPVVRRKSVKCTFCSIRKKIANLMKQCDSSTNFQTLEKAISKLVVQAKTAISKFEKAVSQVQAMVQDLKPAKRSLNAFDLMCSSPWGATPVAPNSTR